MVLSRFLSGALIKALKWALMSSMLFWAIVYRLSSAGAGLPQFVYANF
jgi:hypothetical protein